jgi:hypothetical protein
MEPCLAHEPYDGFHFVSHNDFVEYVLDIGLPGENYGVSGWHGEVSSVGQRPPESNCEARPL